MSNPTKKQREERIQKALKLKQRQFVEALEEDARIDLEGRRPPNILARVNAFEHGEPEDDVDAAFLEFIRARDPKDPTTTFSLHMWCAIREFIDDVGLEIRKKTT